MTSRSWLFVALAFVTGALVTASVMLLVTGGSAATSDAEASCQAVQRVGTVDRNLPPEQLRRIGGAVELAAAATEADAKYAPLSEQLEKLRSNISVLNVEGANASLTDARRVCGELM